MTQWVLASTLGVVFLTWFFSTVDRRTTEEQIIDDYAEKVRRARLEEKVSNSRQEIYRDVIVDIENELKRLGISYINVEISDSQFVWVQLARNEKGASYLANTLCTRAKKHFIKGVAVFDSNEKPVGRAICK